MGGKRSELAGIESGSGPDLYFAIWTLNDEIRDWILIDMKRFRDAQVWKHGSIRESNGGNHSTAIGPYFLFADKTVVRSSEKLLTTDTRIGSGNLSWIRFHPTSFIATWWLSSEATWPSDTAAISQTKVFGLGRLLRLWLVSGSQTSVSKDTLETH